MKSTWNVQILCALALLLLATACQGEQTPAADLETDARFVSPEGDDDATGSASAPWRTIQHAVDSVGPGGTIYVQEGVYHEAVVISNSGSEDGGYITLRNYPGHRPAIVGTGEDDAALVYIHSKHHLKIIGFELGPMRVSRGFPAAIWVLGASHHVEIRDNYVHHVENDDDAHGIAVYGTAADPAHDIVIDGNEIAYCRLGSSESLVLNGNVEQFVVSNNLIHDNDNIGIDIIGHEGKCADGTLDRARDGVVVGNTVYNIDSRGNPAYGEERCADGIYVDGGTRIVIEKNVVHDCNIGIELASEHYGKDTSYVTVRDNWVYRSHTTGIAFGGYDERRGSTHHCEIVNNTLYENDSDETGGGEISIQYDTHDNTIEHNVIYAGPQSLFISNDYIENAANRLDHNVYYSPGGPDGSEWYWKGEQYTAFTAWQRGSGNDLHSLFGDPGLRDPASGDLHVEPGSIAAGAGAALDP